VRTLLLGVLAALDARATATYCEIAVLSLTESLFALGAVPPSGTNARENRLANTTGNSYPVYNFGAVRSLWIELA